MIPPLRCRWFGHRWRYEEVPVRVANEPGWAFFRCFRCGWQENAFKAGPGEYIRVPDGGTLG